MSPTTTMVATGRSAPALMLPGMSSPEPSYQELQRVVRFDNECVLIPESPKTKRAVSFAKSVSLPLWKKRGPHSDSSDVEEGNRARSPSPEDSRVVIKVPIPTFRRRSSRSPTRGRSASHSPVVPTKLPPSCLVHRSPSNPPMHQPLSPVRRSSLQTKYQRKKDELTVPLRACCQACEKITEECIKEGDHWQEKFSRGARRRRSASLDQNDFPTAAKVATHQRSASLTMPHEFSTLSSGVDEAKELEAQAVAEAEADAAATRGAKFALTVDEVDKRRKSFDCSKEQGVEQDLEPPSPGFSSSSSLVAPSPSSSSAVFHSPPYAYSAPPRRLPGKPHDRDISSSSTTSSTSDTDSLTPTYLERQRLRSSPIAEEEDEALLFPLPRRSPSGSGTPSPKASPAPSPNASTTFLPGTAYVQMVAGCMISGGGKRSSCSSRTPSGSGGSASPASIPKVNTLARSNSSSSSKSSSQESLLKSSLSRKPATGVGIGTPGGDMLSPSSAGKKGRGSRNASPSSPLATASTSALSTSSSSSPSTSTDSTTSVSTLSSTGPTTPPTVSAERSTSPVGKKYIVPPTTPPKGPRPSPVIRRQSVDDHSSTPRSGSPVSPTGSKSLRPVVPLKVSTDVTYTAVTGVSVKPANSSIAGLPHEKAPSTGTDLVHSLQHIHEHAHTDILSAEPSSYISTSSTSNTSPSSEAASTSTTTPSTPKRTRTSPATLSGSTPNPVTSSPTKSFLRTRPSLTQLRRGNSRSDSSPVQPPASKNDVFSSSSALPPTTPSSASPPTPASPSQKRKHSFTSSIFKAGGALKGVGVDVLKGVSSMSGAVV